MTLKTKLLLHPVNTNENCHMLHLVKFQTSIEDKACLIKFLVNGVNTTEQSFS